MDNKKKMMNSLHRRSASVDACASMPVLPNVPIDDSEQKSDVGTKRKSVLLNVSKRSHAYSLFEQLVKENHQWNLTTGRNCDVIIPDNKRDFKVSPGYNQIINRYPFINIIGRKDIFQRIIETAEHFNPNSYDFIPRTFILPEEMYQFKNYQKIAGKSATFISKPSSGAKGNKIMLFWDLKELSSFKDGPSFVV